VGKNVFFLVYTDKGERSTLSLRELSLDSRDFIKVRGARAREIFRSIMSVLDAYALRYNSLRRKNKTVVELPGDVGYAILVYLLLVYGARSPSRWISFLERLLAGKIPLSSYLSTFISLAVDISELKADNKPRKTVVRHEAAKVVSSIMRMLAKVL